MVDDLRYAVRSLLSSRGFTVVALLVIALSVGAIAPIYSIVDAVSLRPLPYPEADRLVVVRDIDIPVSQTGRLPMSQRNYVDWREHQQGFENLSAVRSGGGTIRDIGGGESQLSLGRVTGGFFQVLRQVPQLGRPIVPADEKESRRVIVLSHALWQRLFGGRRDVVGETLTITGDTYEVIGVARRDFLFPAGSARGYEGFIPLAISARERNTPQRGVPFLTSIGRLRDGVSIADAQASMDGVAEGLKGEHPGWDAGVILQPYHEYVTARSAKWMRLLLWGVALVFLIMCANVANLLLARGGARRKEVGVRAALGASRARIARQLVVESLLLTSAGTALGLLIGWWVLELFRSALPAGIPRANEIAMDWRVLFIAVASALATGGLFGLAPAVFASRVDLASSLKSGAGAHAPGAGSWLRHLLVVGEIAVALVLVAGAALFLTSFLKVASVPLGVDYRGVAITSLQMTIGGAASPVSLKTLWAETDRIHDVATRLVERLRAVPGVEDVAAASGTPFSGGSRFSYELPGRPGFKWSRDQHRMVAMKMVSPDYLQVLRIPLIRGRYLSEGDTRDAEGAIVVSQSAARMIWPGEDPIGQEIDLQKHLRVVGVVADVRMGGPETEPWPDVYVPLLQGRGSRATTILVRTSLPAAELLPSLRTAIREVDPSQPVRDLTTLESRLEGLLAQRRFNMLVVGAFGLLGVLIAAIGLYGVMAYLVTQRTHEIGIRMALGASRGRVLRLVLSRAALLAGAGLVIGGAGVWYFSAVVRSFLFELDPLDARILAAAVAVMALTALAASAVPARRAASVDPLIALRQD